MKISDDLFFNIVQDWKKNRISPQEKSDLLKAFLKEKGLSERELSRKLGISHSTLNDWISMRQIKNTGKYIALKNKIGVYMYADRLYFLLMNNKEFTDREKRKLKELKELLNSESFRDTI